MLFAAALLLSVGCTSDDDTANVVKRDTDEVNLAYADGSTSQITVRYDGRWEAEVSTGCDWLTLSTDGVEPAASISSVGNGTDYQYLNITAERNTGDAREAVVYLRESGSQQALEIAVSQDAGIFEVSKPELRGDIKQNVESSAYIVVPYLKAIGGESVVIETVLSGVSAGLAVESPWTTAIDKEGDGQLTLPLTGTAQEMGSLEVALKVTIDGKVVYEGALNASVVNDNFIWSFGFDKLLYGADQMHNLPGYIPGGAQIDITEGVDWTATTGDAPGSTTTDGVKDAFKGNDTATTDTSKAYQDYYNARDLIGWSGCRCYEHPGYFKMGTGSNNGWIQTPAMGKVSSLSAAQDIVVSFDAAMWTGSAEPILFEVVGAGELMGNGSVTPEVNSSWKSAKWTTFTFTVKGATSATAFKWSTEATDGSGRFFLDNIKVMGSASIVERTEPLDTPQNFTAAVEGTTVTLAWDKVEGADNYRLTIAAATQPDFVKSVDTSANTLKITRLQEGTTYNITLTAVYSADEKWNSEAVAVEAVTEGGVKIDPLTAPSVKLYEKTHGYAVIEWSYDEKALAEQELGAADLVDFRLKDAAGNVIEGRSLENYNLFAFARYKHMRFVYAGLNPGTKYRIEMRRRIVEDNLDKYLDSEWVGVDVTTDAAPDRSGWLFFADFENFPYGAQPITCAYGTNIDAGVTDYTSQIILGSGASKNTVYNPSRVTGNEGYAATYFPQWSYEDVSGNAADGKTYNVALAGGVMKFGGGSKPAHIWLPAVDHTGDVIFEIDAMPYYEPSNTKDEATNGNMQENCAAENGKTFHVAIVEGEGAIVEVDGAAVAATDDAELTNVLARDMFGGTGAEAMKRYEMTHHTVKITGITPATRIKVYTAGSGNNPRMWADNMGIRIAR